MTSLIAIGAGIAALTGIGAGIEMCIRDRHKIEISYYR